MKNFLQISLLSIALVGCSSIDYAELTSPVSPSKTQIDRIIALNLSHMESLKEANKLMDPVLVSSVIKALETRKVKADNAAIEAENVTIYAEMVQVSDDNLKFLGSKISEIKTRNMIGKPESLDYFLIGLKDQNDGSIQHKLNFSISYTSGEKRNYSSASICDKWQGCDDESQLDINLISSNASNCSTSGCKYTEIMELNLSDDLLRINMNDDFSVSFNSKKADSTVTFISTYLKGYLLVAN